MAWSFALPGDFLYVLIFSLVADKFIPVFCREIIFMVFDESSQAVIRLSCFAGLGMGVILTLLCGVFSEELISCVIAVGAEESA